MGPGLRGDEPGYIEMTTRATMQDFLHKVIGSKDVYIVRDHHWALLPWSIVRRRINHPLNLITLDHHTDTRHAFLAHIYHALNRSPERINSVESERLRGEMIDAIHYQDEGSIRAAIEKLRHDEHVSAATLSGVINFAYVVQLMDSSGTATAKVPNDRILIVATRCMPGCEKSPHDQECVDTLYDNVLDSSFLDFKLKEADEISSAWGAGGLSSNPYILDVDLDYFHTRRSVAPENPNAFLRLAKNSVAITIALEPECVEELQAEGEGLSAEYLLAHLESLILQSESFPS
jgi:hypothetical protein